MSIEMAVGCCQWMEVLKTLEMISYSCCVRRVASCTEIISRSLTKTVNLTNNSRSVFLVQDRREVVLTGNIA